MSQVTKEGQTTRTGQTEISPQKESVKTRPEIYERAAIAAEVAKRHGIASVWEFAVFCLGAASVGIASEPVRHATWWKFCTRRVADYHQARYACERALHTTSRFIKRNKDNLNLQG